MDYEERTASMIHCSVHPEKDSIPSLIFLLDRAVRERGPVSSSAGSAVASAIDTLAEGCSDGQIYLRDCVIGMMWREDVQLSDDNTTLSDSLETVCQSADTDSSIRSRDWSSQAKPWMSRSAARVDLHETARERRRRGGGAIGDVR